MKPARALTLHLAVDKGYRDANKATAWLKSAGPDGAGQFAHSQQNGQA